MKITDLLGEATEYDKKQAVERKKIKSWLKSISAFANTAGGILIFGITNNEDFESFGIRDAQGRLTNAGALLADDSPIRWSRLFCTRWNGLDKSGGQVDALDSAEYTGSGLCKIRTAYENAANYKAGMEPTFRSNHVEFSVKLPNLNFKASNDEALNEALNEALTENQKLLLDILRNSPTITQKEIIANTSLARSTVQRVIKELTEMGRLERVAQRKLAVGL